MFCGDFQCPNYYHIISVFVCLFVGDILCSPAALELMVLLPLLLEFQDSTHGPPCPVLSMHLCLPEHMCNVMSGYKCGRGHTCELHVEARG